MAVDFRRTETRPDRAPPGALMVSRHKRQSVAGAARSVRIVVRQG